jgi:hypothetical protein
VSCVRSRREDAVNRCGASRAGGGEGKVGSRIGSTLLLHTSLSFLFSLAELPIQSFTRVALPVPFGELAPGVEEPADC